MDCESPFDQPDVFWQESFDYTLLSLEKLIEDGDDYATIAPLQT